MPRAHQRSLFDVKSDQVKILIGNKVLFDPVSRRGIETSHISMIYLLLFPGFFLYTQARETKSHQTPSRICKIEKEERVILQDRSFIVNDLNE